MQLSGRVFFRKVWTHWRICASCSYPGQCTLCKSSSF